MIIALLAVIGVDLVVIVALVAALVGRRRWLRRQPGAFLGAIRVTDGEIDGLGASWRRGHLRWVRDVLVWTRAPLSVRNLLLSIDRVVAERHADPDDRPKRLGDHPVVLSVNCEGATVEVAARAADSARLRGPYLEKEHA